MLLRQNIVTGLIFRVPKGEGGCLKHRNFCCGAWSPDECNTWIPEYVNTVKPEPQNEMLWSPGAPKFLSWSPGARHILGQSPGALNPFGTLNFKESHTCFTIIDSRIQRNNFTVFLEKRK